jgi:hypothetical protein
MIYLNDERLTESAFPEQYSFYQEKMEEIRKKKHVSPTDNYYVFYDPRPTRLGLDGRKEQKKRFSFPASASKDGMRWTWCRSIERLKDNVIRYNPEYFLFYERLSLNPKKTEEAEQIFFLLFISEEAKRIMHLRNLEEEARKENLQYSAEADVRYLIMSPNSPLSTQSCGTDKVMRDVAAAWHVSYADTMAIEMLKKKLYETVKDSEKKKASTKRGFIEFVDDVNTLPRIALRSKIQRAIDNGIIMLSEERGKKLWKYTHSTKVILPVQVYNWDTPQLALEDYLGRNQRERDEFEDTVNIFLKGKEGNVQTENLSAIPTELTEQQPAETAPPITEEQIDKMNFFKLKGVLAKSGIKVEPSAKALEVRQRAKENINKLIVV